MLGSRDVGILRREFGFSLHDSHLTDLQGAMDHMWLLLCGALVMFMQVGFASLETGAVRAKNSVS